MLNDCFRYLPVYDSLFTTTAPKEIESKKLDVFSSLSSSSVSSLLPSTLPPSITNSILYNTTTNNNNNNTNNTTTGKDPEKAIFEKAVSKVIAPIKSETVKVEDTPKPINVHKVEEIKNTSNIQ